MFESNNKSIFIFTSPCSEHHIATSKKFPPTETESDMHLAKGKELAFSGQKMEHLGQFRPKGTVLWILPSTVLISFESFV